MVVIALSPTYKIDDKADGYDCLVYDQYKVSASMVTDSCVGQLIKQFLGPEAR